MPRRRAFTLIEVAASLAVAGFVLLVARAVFDSAATARRAVSDAVDAADAGALGERTLRELAAQARVRDSASFAGLPTSARFATSCRAAGGWEESCEVRLSARSDSTPALAARADALGGYRLLLTGAASYSLTFLRSEANGGDWVDTWPAARQAPEAIGVVVPGDTMILPLGVRR